MRGGGGRLGREKERVDEGGGGGGGRVGEKRKRREKRSRAQKGNGEKIVPEKK